MSRIIVLFFAVLSLFVFVAQSASAAGMSVSPYNGDYNTTFTAHVSGFLPGEHVHTWVNKPSQWRVGQGEYIADAHGAFDFDFRPDVTWGTGGFFASAQGTQSGLEFTASFTISADGYPLAPCACGAVFLGNPGGTAVNYNAQGYGSSERVMVYMTDPSAQIQRLPDAQADPWGNLAFPIYLSQDSLYGPYLFTVRGLTTGRETYNTFTFWGGIFNHRSSNPISFATPVFELNAGDFKPQESISIQLTYPNHAMRVLAKVNAGDDGSLHYQYIVPPGSPFGEYVLSAVGATSLTGASARFKWDGTVSLVQ
jgi:hypothetical protein